jgi:hypothetical protein
MNLADFLARYAAPTGSVRPLVVQCGEEKRPGVHPAGELYLGPWWTTFRAARRERSTPLPFPVYVLSAKYGLVGVETPIASYDALLAERPRAANEVAVADIVPILRNQRAVVGDAVDMIGSALYADALTRAGFTVNRLETRGYAYMRGALRRHLLS